MPKTTPEEMPSLFGDVKQTLPESNETIEDIRLDIGNCTRCPLWEGRTQIVHSTGNREADLMFVGEAPGADEDAQGEPFVGRSGQLLTKIIESIGMKREDVFIGNINRCRPPGNRAPTLARSTYLPTFFDTRNRCCPPENNRRDGKYGDEKSARHERRNHQNSRRISGLLRRKSDADISSGVSFARPAKEARSLGRYEKSA